MTTPDPFRRHVPRTELHVNLSSEADIRHEVLFEDGLSAIRRQPLYVGRAFGRRRFFAAALFPAFLLTGLLGRAAWMQLVRHDQYQSFAESNRLRNAPIWPRRGLILDRNGRVLAQNIARFQVTLSPRDLPEDPDARQLVLGQAARLLGTSIAALEQETQATGTETVLVKNDLPYREAVLFAVAEPQLSGFRLEERARRLYPLTERAPSLSHVLGYLGKISPDEYAAQKDNGYGQVDELGKTGVERSYETRLRGSVGDTQSEVDAQGRVTASLGSRPATDGRDLTLSLDADLQAAAEDALKNELQAAGIKHGSLVALDPRDGSVLALVSWPAYDDNVFSGGVSSTVYAALVGNPDEPLFPRAWAGLYPSGSTIKPVIAAGALADKIITPQTSVLSVGGIRVGPQFFPDWKPGGHGPTNVRYALAWSVNTFFYTVGGGYQSFIGLGVDRLTAWMRRFGLGSKTGLDLPGEAAGFVPSKEWKQQTKGERWFVGDTYNLSIGQGDLLVTPIQVAAYTAAIANGGHPIIPHVASSTDAVSDGLQASNLLADSDAIKVVQEGMRDAVTYGSARFLNDLPIKVAGKTGTAQWRNDKPNHAWFTGYAPFDKPEIAITVMLEQGGEGSTTAVPVAKRVLYEWWRLKQQRGGKF